MSDPSDQAKRERMESLYLSFRRSFPDVLELTPEELRALMEKEQVVLVDVRSEKEQKVSMIPGAISFRQFEQDESAHEGATVVAYCTIGGRSGKFAKRLHDKGWKVFNLRGSLLGWTHAGGALDCDEGPTRRVHVFRSKFSLAPESYEPVW